ncbi:MAG: tRNA adenosine(34) deaminase TadA [Woeseiaceae bacterium]|nr:tRNA adenosine(34) deaminase TadA [Woeseiaceae bacterium]
MGWSETDRDFMQAAIDEARAAHEAGEVPVGAVLVYEGQVAGRAGNRTITDSDPSAHAEILAIREAAAAIGNHRLNGSTLYVTLEPCPMCASAISQARVQRVVFGAYDDKAGAYGSAVDMTESPALNHRSEVNGGVMADDIAAMLKSFFESRR